LEARFQSAADLAFALDTLSAGSDTIPRSALTGSSPQTTRAGPSSARLAGLAALAVVTGAAVGLLASRMAGPPPATPVVARVHSLTDLIGLEDTPALAPDGKSVAFVATAGGRRQIFVRLLAGGASLQITGDPVEHLFPRWSPDASSIVYFTPAGPGEAQGTLREVSALGGVSRRIATAVRHHHSNPTPRDQKTPTHGQRDERERETQKRKACTNACKRHEQRSALLCASE
jgi:dipeptidyl aminopeptidase/acylaminoacyl peptidase